MITDSAAKRSKFNKRVIGLLLVLIVPGLVAIVSELNNRVTAEAFIREELNNVRRAITQVPRQTPSLEASTTTPSSAVASDIATTTRISQLSLRENVAREVQIGLKALAVSGTKGTTHTVSGLISHYMDYLRAELRGGSVEAARVVVDEAEIALIDQITLLLGGFVERETPSDIGNLLDLLRGTTNQIPQINTITNQSQAIVRQFDFELLNLLRELDADRTSFVDPSDWTSKFYALQQSASTVTSTLEARKQEIIGARDQEAQSTTTSPEPTPIPRIQSEAKATDIFTFISAPFELIAKGSTTSLTIVLGVLSGCLGALFLGLVSERVSAFLYLMKGAVAGLVAIFVVKGGNTLLTVNFSEATDVANPFSVAFIAFVVGLFSDRFFEYLKTLVEKATESKDDPNSNGQVQQSETLDEKRADRVMEAHPEETKVKLAEQTSTKV